MTRTQERETAFSIIYETAFFGWENAAERLGTEQEQREFDAAGYIGMAVTGVADNIDRIDEMIARHTKGWKPERLDRVSMAIMRLSVYEMICRDDIPCSVSINEAVELGKKYGADNAPKFINGVLSAVAETAGLKKK